MNHKSERDCSIPNLRQQVVEQWYQEWETPKDTLGTVPYQQVLKPLAHLPSMIRHLFHPATNSESTSAPRSNMETGSAL